MSIDRLAVFKSSYYDHDDAIAEHPPKIIGIASKLVELLLLAVFYHAMGYVSACWDNEFVCEALEKIDRPCPSIDI